MLDRLQSLADRYEKLSELLCDPDVANDPNILRSNPAFRRRTRLIRNTKASSNSSRRLGRCRPRNWTMR